MELGKMVPHIFLFLQLLRFIYNSKNLSEILSRRHFIHSFDVSEILG